MRMLLLGTAFLMSLSGCITTKVQNTSATPGDVKDYTTVHWLWGFGKDTVKPDCPNGVASIGQGRTFGNAMLGGLTLGIYNPNTIRVTCAK
jgi:hypothetical protein